MDVNLWQKIVDELGSIRFAGRLSPFLYGEPLMDKRLADFVRYARARCPYAVIQVNTNGDFLDEGSMRRFIMAGIDLFYVTDYEPTPQVRLQELQSQYPYWMNLRHGLAKITNRAGMLLDIGNKRIDDPCFRPSSQLIINWKGEVLLCCQDFYARRVFGNVRDRTIGEIWHSAEFNAVREVLEKPGGRRKYDMCKGCDA